MYDKFDVHPFLATYSLLIHNPETQEIGVLSASKFLAVGSLAYSHSSDIGIAVSQAFVNPLSKQKILDASARGMGAQASLSFATSLDPHPELRQLAILRFDGELAAFSGDRIEAEAGYLAFDGGIAIGNVLASMEVLSAMKSAVMEGRRQKRSVLEILISAAHASEAVGGDKRGKQSAGLLIARQGRFQPYCDLRVDDHEQPVVELARLALLFQNTYQQLLAQIPSEVNPGGSVGLNRLVKQEKNIG